MSDRIGLEWPAIAPLGDSALTIRLGDHVDRALAARVRELADRIRAARIASVTEMVGGYAALTVWYHVLRADYDAMLAALAPVLSMGPPTSTELPRAHAGREHLVPVIYDGPTWRGRSTSDRARRVGRDRTARRSMVRGTLIGFVPGWGYLGDLDPALVLPRRTEPRPRVPAGSVAIPRKPRLGYTHWSHPAGGGSHFWSDIRRLLSRNVTPPALLAPGIGTVRARYSVTGSRGWRPRALAISPP